MTPCSSNRESIAELALDALDARQQRRLRAHLGNCEGCRGYLAEISSVTKTLRTIEIRSDIQTSETFHRRVAGKLRAEETASGWGTVLADLRAAFLTWRVTLSVLGATAMVVAALSLFVGHPGDLRTHRSPAPFGSPPVTLLKGNPSRDLDPTIAHYQMVANRSFEKLDELLTRQGNRNLSPAPLYTASTLGLADGLD